jgi:hypothetical protein
MINENQTSTHTLGTFYLGKPSKIVRISVFASSGSASEHKHQICFGCLLANMKSGCGLNWLPVNRHQLQVENSGEWNSGWRKVGKRPFTFHSPTLSLSTQVIKV